MSTSIDITVFFGVFGLVFFFFFLQPLETAEVPPAGQAIPVHPSSVRPLREQP